MNKAITLFLIALCSIYPPAYGALHSDTLIHLPHGFLSIQNLAPSQLVVSSHANNSCVTNISQSCTNIVYEITSASESLHTTANQLFYDPQIDEWIPAHSLSKNNTLLDIHDNYVPCLRVKKLYETHEVYELSLEDPHTFFIGKTGILTHNVIACAPVAPIIFTTVCKTITILGAIVGSLWKYHRDNKQKNMAPSSSTATTSPPPIKPPDDDKHIHKFSKLEIEKSVKHVMHDKNRIHHIFGKKLHNLDSIVKKLGGPEPFIRKIIQKLNGKVPYNGILKNTVVYINKYPVHIRGKIINGVLKIGTLFIP